MPCSPVTVPPSASAARYRSVWTASVLASAGRVAALEDEVRVEVAVAGVPERPDPDVVLGGDPLDRAEHVRHARAAARRRPPSGRRRAARARNARSAAPGAASRPPGRRRPGRRRSRRRRGRRPRPARARRSAATPGMSDSTISIAAAVRSRPRLCMSSTARDREPVEQLERDRRQPGGGDPGDGLPRAVERREEGEHRRARRRRRPEPEGRLGDDPERPLAADEQVRQRVAGDVLDVLAAGPDDRAVGHHDLERQDRVARLAVLHAAQAAGVRAEVAADRAHLVAGRVGRVEQALGGDRGLERPR